MDVPFKAELNFGTSNLANEVRCAFSRREHPLQDDEKFQVYYLLKLDYANQIRRLLKKGVRVIYGSGGSFLTPEHSFWPEKTPQIVRKNPQGTQIPHVDNTEPNDPRRWNLFANEGEREAVTFFMARELVPQYVEKFLSLASSVRSQFEGDLQDIDTNTPIDPTWFDRFMNGAIQPDIEDELAFYWFFEIMTKCYRGENYLKAELDEFIALVYKNNPGQVHLQLWKDPSYVIGDNIGTLHCRFCPKTEEVPLPQRRMVRRLWIADTEPNSISAAMTS